MTEEELGKQLRERLVAETQFLIDLLEGKVPERKSPSDYFGEHRPTGGSPAWEWRVFCERSSLPLLVAEGFEDSANQAKEIIRERIAMFEAHGGHDLWKRVDA